MKRFIVCALATSLLVLRIAAEENAVRHEFLMKYLAWKKYTSRPEVMAQSIAGTRISSPLFESIVQMGPAVLPCVASKMEEDPEATVLWQAFVRLAKVNIRGVYEKSSNRVIFPDYPDLGPNENVYIHWWKKGRFRTAELFVRFHGRWRSLNSEGKREEAQEMYRKIVDLGLPVLPYLVDAAEDCPELCPAIIELSGGALMRGASVEACKRWWTLSRDGLQLPAPDGPR